MGDGGGTADGVAGVGGTADGAAGVGGVGAWGRTGTEAWAVVWYVLTGARSATGSGLGDGTLRLGFGSANCGDAAMDAGESGCGAGWLNPLGKGSMARLPIPASGAAGVFSSASAVLDSAGTARRGRGVRSGNPT